MERSRAAEHSIRDSKTGIWFPVQRISRHRYPLFMILLPPYWETEGNRAPVFDISYWNISVFYVYAVNPSDADRSPPLCFMRDDGKRHVQSTWKISILPGFAEAILFRFERGRVYFIPIMQCATVTGSGSGFGERGEYAESWPKFFSLWSDSSVNFCN